VHYAAAVARQLLAGVLLAYAAALGGQFTRCNRDETTTKGGADSVSAPRAKASGGSRDPPAAVVDRQGAGSTRPADLSRLRDTSYALVLQLPEWKARAAETATVRGDTLGLSCEDEPRPLGCERSKGSCRFSCEAIRVCGSGACAGGRWLGFEVDPLEHAVFVEDASTSAFLPYGRWRNRFRAQAREAGGAAYRALTAPAQAFPDHQTGLGEFGYGSPNEVSTRATSTLVEVVSRGGYRILRTETYGPHNFNVYVLQRAAASSSDDGARAFRSWGAELVRANGNRACEVVIVRAANEPPERFQFDRFVLEGAEGGVYAFVGEAFHPRATTYAINIRD
jgi:hypothetical protein